MSTTTYIARFDASTPVTGDFARTSPSMAYTHAVVYSTGAGTWHTSKALADKANTRGGRVVAVEAHQGGKATVLRRLAAAEVATFTLTQAGVDRIQKHTGEDPKVIVAAAKAEGWKVETTDAPAPVAREARTWNATASATHTCAGACGQELPAQAFPTTAQAGRRGVVCRKDRDAARAAKVA